MAVFSREFKLMAVSRLAEAKDVSALARELGVRRLQLYRWHWAFEAGGAAALGGAGRRAAARSLPAAETLALARERIAGLERKLGQQQLELDFFRQALRQVEGLGRPSDMAGATASTPSSRR
jgi:transposase-like protein